MRLLLFISLLTILVASSCSTTDSQASATVVIQNSESQEFDFTVELAITPEAMTKGLMFRESLQDDEGMLFVYSDTEERTFWMKNTLIPLDMLFIDEDTVIRKIHHAVPCKEEPCPVYKSESPAKYVLEIRGNLTKELRIEEGDTVLVKLKY